MKTTSGNTLKAIGSGTVGSFIKVLRLEDGATMYWTLRRKEAR